MSNEKSIEGIAKKLYKAWFEKHPDISNPTDLNREEKFIFAMNIGWRNYALMQRFRKANTKINGYPHPWTMAGFWQMESPKTSRDNLGALDSINQNRSKDS